MSNCTKKNGLPVTRKADVTKVLVLKLHVRYGGNRHRKKEEFAE